MRGRNQGVTIDNLTNRGNIHQGVLGYRNSYILQSLQRGGVKDRALETGFVDVPLGAIGAGFPACLLKPRRVGGTDQLPYYKDSLALISNPPNPPMSALRKIDPDHLLIFYQKPELVVLSGESSTLPSCQ